MAGCLFEREGSMRKCPVCKNKEVKKRGSKTCVTCGRECGLKALKNKMGTIMGFKPSVYPPEYWEQRWKK